MALEYSQLCPLTSLLSLTGHLLSAPWDSAYASALPVSTERQTQSWQPSCLKSMFSFVAAFFLYTVITLKNSSQPQINQVFNYSVTLRTTYILEMFLEETPVKPNLPFHFF